MKYISHYLNKPVRYKKERQGVIKDWVMEATTTHALLAGILVEDKKGQEIIVAMAEVEHLGTRYIYLKKPLEQCRTFAASDESIFMVRHILDKQVIDTKKKKVYRVNDIEVQEENGRYTVLWVDAGLSGLLQRFGVSLPEPRRFVKLQRKIAWADIEPLDPDLKSTFQKLAKLHPADLADIIEELGVSKGADLLERLDDETAADALTEVEPAMQSDIVEEIKPQDAADIIEEMEPDDAADLISDLPKDTAREIMAEMEKDERQEVKDLLKYPEDSAGGIMNTEYLSVAKNLTAEQVLKKFRNQKPEPEVAYNIVVLDEQNRLAGLLSLRDLVVAEPGTKIESIMMADLPSVPADALLEEVADLMHKYDLMALPVVDPALAVLGVITVDDVMERVVPEKWKRSHRKRFPFSF
jgi:magnesium transporter